MVRILCGLGNPAPQFDHTRHNLGYDIIDRLAARIGISLGTAAAWFEYGMAGAGSAGVALIKPITSVNRTGVAIKEALDLFRADPSELFVISDDFHLPLGTLRIRKSGSSGGHRGLASIIEGLGRSDFARLRAGIGPLPESASADPDMITRFVLSVFRPEEAEIVDAMVSRAVEALEVILAGDLDLAISRYNRANPTPER